MKFALKYPNQKVGDLANEDDMILGRNELPCVICDEPTRFVNICSEGRFCSEECLRKFWDDYRKTCGGPCMAEDFMEVV